MRHKSQALGATHEDGYQPTHDSATDLLVLRDQSVSCTNHWAGIHDDDLATAGLWSVSENRHDGHV